MFDPGWIICPMILKITTNNILTNITYFQIFNFLAKNLNFSWHPFKPQFIVFFIPWHEITSVMCHSVIQSSHVIDCHFLLSLWLSAYLYVCVCIWWLANDPKSSNSNKPLRVFFWVLCLALLQICNKVNVTFISIDIYKHSQTHIHLYIFIRFYSRFVEFLPVMPTNAKWLAVCLSVCLFVLKYKIDQYLDNM